MQSLLSQAVRGRVMDKEVVRDRIGFSHPLPSHLLSARPRLLLRVKPLRNLNKREGARLTVFLTRIKVKCSKYTVNYINLRAEKPFRVAEE